MAMQSENILVQTSTAQPNGIACKSDILDLADGYVKAHIGESFIAANPKFFEESNTWTFTVFQKFADLQKPVMAWHIEVDAVTKEVYPLTDEDIWDARERAIVFAEHKRGNRIARGTDGLILPYQAKLKVNSYIGDTVAFFANSDGIPTLVKNSPPFWRVNTALRLRGFGKVTDLGSVDVNAISGQVVSLSEDDIKARQEKARDAAAAAKRSTTANG